MSETNLETTATETTTEAVQAAPVEKPEKNLSPEEQRETTIKILRLQQEALNKLVVLDLRNYLNMLTSPNVNEATKKQIKDSMVRAFEMGFDYGVDVVKPSLREYGTLAKMENAFAAHMARLRENGMIIIADNMEKNEKELLSQKAAELLKTKGESSEKNITQENDTESEVNSNNEKNDQAISVETSNQNV